MSQKYQVIVKASEQGIEVCLLEGPCSGELVGYAEQAQLRDATVLDDGRVVGYMTALWGMTMVKDDLDELSTLSLSLLGAFRSRTLRQIPEARMRYRTLQVQATRGGWTMRAEA